LESSGCNGLKMHVCHIQKLEVIDSISKVEVTVLNCCNVVKIEIDAYLCKLLNLIWNSRVIKVNAISRILTVLTREEVRNTSRISLALSSVKLLLLHKRKVVPGLLPFSAQMQGEMEVNRRLTALSTSKN